MHEGCRETFGKRKNTRAAGECIALDHVQVHRSRYPKCIDHAILLRKPFGIIVL